MSQAQSKQLKGPDAAGQARYGTRRPEPLVIGFPGCGYPAGAVRAVGAQDSGIRSGLLARGRGGHGRNAYTRAAAPRSVPVRLKDPRKHVLPPRLMAHPISRAPAMPAAALVLSGSWGSGQRPWARVP